MIIAEREVKREKISFDDFGQAMTDGRLTESVPDKIYRLREAILLSKRLGRSLTTEEMKRFEV